MKTYSTKDISSNTESPLLQAFKDFADILNTSKQYPWKCTIEIPTASGPYRNYRYIIKPEYDVENNEQENAERNKLRELMSKVIQYHITEKKAIRYHNIDVQELYDENIHKNFAPLNKLYFKTKHVLSYDYKKYKKMIKARNVLKTSQIRNLYDLLKYENQPDYAINNYYSGAIKPSSREKWGKQNKFIFSKSLIKDSKFSTDDVLKNLPEYISLFFPSVVMQRSEDLIAIDNSFKRGFYQFFTYHLQTVDSEQIPIPYLGILNWLDYESKKEIELFNGENNYLSSMKFNEFIKLDDIILEKILKKEDIYLDDSTYDFSDTLPDVKVITDFINETYTKKTLFETVINKKKTPFIPLFYKVKKFIKGHKTPDQEYYIRAESDEALNFLDNQLLPNEIHSYSVSLIGLSVGVKYTIQTDSAAGDPIYVRVFTVDEQNCDVDLMIYEVPIAQQILAPQDAIYPVIPVPEINHLIDEPNVLKIFLNFKTSTEVPRYLSTQEVPAYWLGEYDRIMPEALNINNFSDNNIEFIYVYRLEHKPKSYEEFLSGRIVSLDYDKTEFYDAIQNNKKFYYMFRTHNGTFFSNPSDIYEVEIKNVNGAIIPLISMYNINTGNEEDRTLKTNLSFKQRVSIEPSFYQLAIKEVGEFIEGTFLNSNIWFSTEEFKNLQSIYDNNDYSNSKTFYKIRIKSKLSGKMVDINIKYIYSLEKPTLRNIKFITNSV